MALAMQLVRRATIAHRLSCVTAYQCLPMSSTSKTIARLPGEGHIEKNMRLGRPLAPHLSIYKPQATSMLSIVHRVSGAIQWVYLTAFGVSALVLPFNYATFLGMIKALQLPAAVLFGTKFILAFPAVYHYINGIRHLAWDLGKGFALPDLYRTGYTALTLAILACLYFASL